MIEAPVTAARRGLVDLTGFFAAVQAVLEHEEPFDLDKWRGSEG